MASLGNLFVTLGMKKDGFDQAATGARRQMGQMGREAGVLVKRVAAVGVALGAAGAALATKWTREGLAAIDTSAKLARSLKGTQDEVRALQIVASDAGVDGLEQALARMNRRLGAAENGTGSAVNALKLLNLEARDLSELPLDERMAAISDAMVESGLSAQAAARAAQDLGFEQAEAAQMFLQGGDAIRAARQEVDEYGLSVSAVDSAQVEAANDAFSRISRVVEVIRNRLAVQLAPVIEYIANLINDASKESGGFRDQIDAAVAMGFTGFGHVADAVEGVRRAFLLAGKGAAALGLGIMENMLMAANAILNKPVQAINELLTQMNRIPGVDIEPVGLSGFGEKVQSELRTVREAQRIAVEDMQQTLMAPMPSTGIEARLEQIRLKARQAAQETVAAREQMEGPDTGGAGEGPTEAEQEAEEKHREQLQRRLDRIREANMTEQELARTKAEQDLEILRQSFEAELLTKAEYDEQKRLREQQLQDQLTKITEGGEKDRSKVLGQFAKANQAIRENSIASESAALRAGLQTMFGEQKGFAKAMGFLKRFEAITSAYAWGSSIGGPAAGAAAAAAAGAAQLATLNDMDKTSFSGGSAQAPAGSTGAATQGAAVGGGQESSRNIFVQGIDPNQMISGRQLVDMLNQAEEDGARLRLGGAQ